MTMNFHHLNPSTSLKTRFTTRFIRALNKINSQKPISSTSRREMFQRYRRIKVAADKSMAYSVRSGRIWSRATLWKLRTRSSRLRLASWGRRSLVKSRASTATSNGGEENKEDLVGVGVQTNELRELVPGGEAMDLCNLLDETAHYIICLATQVQVMRTIANLYSLE